MNAKQKNTLRHVFAQTTWQRKGLSIWEALQVPAKTSRQANDRRKMRLGQPIA